MGWKNLGVWIIIILISCLSNWGVVNGLQYIEPINLSYISPHARNKIDLPLQEKINGAWPDEGFEVLTIPNASLDLYEQIRFYEDLGWDDPIGGGTVVEGDYYMARRIPARNIVILAHQESVTELHMSSVKELNAMKTVLVL